MGGPLLLATRSPGKLRELRPMFARAGLSVIDLREAGIAEHPDEESVECHATFEENALAKARYFHARSGMATVADDSGLEVAALNGAPGVRSKRWCDRPELGGVALDEANNAALLRALAGIADRRARYVCVAAYRDGTKELAERGESAGVVIDDPRGTGGFGYDPYFHSLELGRTFGESGPADKEAVSHRGRAFRALIARLSGTGTV
jgi:XTP/dITP diphosphohydrolase